MRYVFPLLISALALFAFSNNTGQVESKVIKAAGKGLPAFLSNIPAGSEKQFGFNDRNEMEAATVAAPYRMLTLSNTFYSAQSLRNTSYKTLITETNEWRAPVTVNGESRLLLTVVSEGGKFSAADLGGAGLARELGSIATNNTHKYHILRVYRLSADFLVDAADGTLGNARCIPLASAKMAIPALNKNGKISYSLPETLQIIKNELNTRPKN